MNFHPWAKNALISDPYNPPPAALSVERTVIDLAKMEVCEIKKIALHFRSLNFRLLEDLTLGREFSSLQTFVNQLLYRYEYLHV